MQYAFVICIESSAYAFDVSYLRLAYMHLTLFCIFACKHSFNMYLTFFCVFAYELSSNICFWHFSEYCTRASVKYALRLLCIFACAQQIYAIHVLVKYVLILFCIFACIFAFVNDMHLTLFCMYKCEHSKTAICYSHGLWVLNWVCPADDVEILALSHCFIVVLTFWHCQCNICCYFSQDIAVTLTTIHALTTQVYDELCRMEGCWMSVWVVWHSV